jgi:hypothetical protein
MPRMGLKSDGRRGLRVSLGAAMTGIRALNNIQTRHPNAARGVGLLSAQGCVKVATGLGVKTQMIRLLLAAAIALPCVGCASVSRGTTENISITSTPPGATAEISGLDNPTSCVTPCVVVAKRSADITITIDKEGYEPQVVPLTKEIPGTGAAGFAGNVLVGGLVGMGVDAYTGAAQDHKPNPVTVTLQPISPAQPRPAKPRPRKRPPPPQS